MERGQFTCSKTLLGHESKVYSLVLSHNDPQMLISSSNDATIRVWDLKREECIRVLTGHTATIWSLTFFPKATTTSPGLKSYLISGSDDKTVKVWDMEQFVCLRTIDFGESKILSVVVGEVFANEQLIPMLFAGTHDCKIRVYNLKDYTEVTTLLGHTWEVWQLALHGQLLFSGSFDQTIKVWDLKTFECKKVLEGHKGFIHALSIGMFSPLSRAFLLSASGDKTIKVWTDELNHISQDEGTINTEKIPN